MLFRFLIHLSCGGFGEYLEGLRQQIESEIAALRAKLSTATERQRLAIQTEIGRLETELREKTGEQDGSCR